jgi:DNA-binding response OmpR family regulator
MTSTPHLLLVDDDDLLRETLADQLSLGDAFVVSQASCAKAGLELLKSGAHFDLVIMDVGLPDMAGFDAVRLSRTQGFKGPILMLTGHDTDADQILGLDAGANDYLTKPFRFAVLLARVRAHLRQHEASDDALFRVGAYRFMPSLKQLVRDNGSKIKLTEKETAILKYLYRAKGLAVARDKLLAEVWGYNAGVTTHTLETHIYRLRQKIEKSDGDFTLLVTEAGGYRLNL